MLIMAFAVFITSCKKDKETDSSQATIAKLQGRWMATSQVEKVYEKAGNKLVSEKTTPYIANQREIEYKGNEITYYFNGTPEDTYSYAIIGTEIRLREDNSGVYYQLKFYSDTQHSHTEEYDYKNNAIEMKEVTETIYSRK